MNASHPLAKAPLGSGLPGGGALLERIGRLTGQGTTTRPAGVSPVLREWFLAWGDALPDEDRQQLRRYVWPLSRSSADVATEHARQWDVVDWTVRVLLPLWLNASWLTIEAQRIGALPPVRDARSLDAARSPIEAAHVTVIGLLQSVRSSVDAGPGYTAPAATAGAEAALAEGRSLTTAAHTASGFGGTSRAANSAAWRAALATTDLAAELVGWRAVEDMLSAGVWRRELTAQRVRQLSHSAVVTALRTVEFRQTEHAHGLVEHLLLRRRPPSSMPM